MSDQPFLKCACQGCGGAIEFPAQGVGLSVQCPHCSQRTLLTAPDPAAAEAPPPIPVAAFVPPSRPVPQPVTPAPVKKSGKFPVLMVFLLLLAGGAVAGGAVWYFKFGPGANPKATASIPNEPDSAVSGKTTKDEPPPKQPARRDTAAKTTDDLKAGPVKLEKAKSGSLMYAVGTVKNDSDLQRFGVKVEITFTDANGKPAGKTSDYTQVIEPRQEWRFRALVLDSKAVSGQVAGIKEDK